MIDVAQVLDQNEPLIKRFIDLLFCRDTIYDSRHRWFYSVIPFEALQLVLPDTSELDIRQDIYLYIIEEAAEYKRSEQEFSNYLRLSLGWRLRDKVNGLLNYHNFKLKLAREAEPPIAYPVDPLPRLDLCWALNDDRLALSSYEKYVLFLYHYRCYTISRIASLTYQDRKTVHNTLETAHDILRSQFNAEATG